MVSVGRLTKKPLAVRMLRSKFEKGEVTGGESLKSVWESDDAFQKHKVGNFRTCYNAMGGEFGSKPNTRGNVPRESAIFYTFCVVYLTWSYYSIFLVIYRR